MMLRAAPGVRSLLSGGTVLALGAGLVVAALGYEGVAVADIRLNDSGVWVTRSSAGQVGRFSYEARELDGVVVADSTDIDVYQDGQDVLVVDRALPSLTVLDATTLTLAGSAELPSGAVTAMNDGVVAVLAATDSAAATDTDTDTGGDAAVALWVMPVSALPGFDASATEPAAELAGPGALAVGEDGSVHVAVPAEAALLTIRTQDGAPTTVLRTTLDGVAADHDVDVTAVGPDAVVLDADTGTLHLPGGKAVAVDDAGSARLQQPGPDASAVLLATTSSLVDQPLDGSQATSRAAQGTPARPVLLGGCAFGAWAGSGTVLRDCAGDAEDLQTELPLGERPEYRVNRTSIVLNDVDGGGLWLPQEEFVEVDQWEVVLPKDEDAPEGDAEAAVTGTHEALLADRDAANTPPVAVEDSFGVRAGRTTILAVLANDSDLDGDVLTAALLGEAPAGLAVEQVQAGAALQVVVPGDATGTSAFTYEVSDGRGGTDSASVTVRVVPESENTDPVQIASPVLTVASAAGGTIDVLPYFRDPDGDDLVLLGAEAGESDGTVRFRPDGTVEFVDGGMGTGRKPISVTISDGRGGTLVGELIVQVSGERSNPPVAVSDFAMTTTGQAATLHPLQNDTDPDGDVLSLAGVSEPAGAVVTADLVAGTVTVLAEKAGSYEVVYQVSDGPNVVPGLIRVDVADPTPEARAPVATPDTALLPADGSVLVDVLANDTDPSGQVLVLLSATADADAGLALSVLDQHLLRISATHRITEATSVEYTVSNGQQTATGQVQVLPLPAAERLRPPVAAEDSATVRAGDVVTVDVLANDTHPDGGELTLLAELAEEPQAGTAFVSEGRLRFHADAAPGTVRMVYRVAGPDGQENSAQVTIYVRADDGSNSVPTPAAVEARTLAGRAVSIPVDLRGIDPDGDSVRLIGIATPPGKGQVIAVAQDAIEYQPSDDASGTDAFAYLVEDTRGGRAQATVSVGIAPRVTANQAPTAVDDAVVLRPGRLVAVDVVANDSDPDGDAVVVVAGATEVPEGFGEVSESEGRLVFTTPAAEGASTLYYTVEDPYGARSQAGLLVEVLADAPLLAPVARDDAVDSAQAADLAEVTVAVLANDEDPDGSARDLEVTTAEPDVVVTAEGELRIPLGEAQRLVPYTVTDPDGLVGRAFVRVPGSSAAPPSLREGAAVEVTAGESVTFALADHVVVASGRQARLTSAATVTAVHGTVTVDDDRTITFTAPEDYAGLTSVSFEVTDTPEGDDAEAGSTALLTLPVTVLPSPDANEPPRAEVATLDVAAGEQAEVDLSRFVTDPEGDELTFAVGEAASGLTVSAQGPLVTVAAPAEAVKGSVVTVPATVEDGVNPPVEMTLQVTLVSSTRRLARANDDVVADARQGSAETVQVLANDDNPFPEIGPLQVSAASVETGRGTVSFDASTVTVTPAADYVGTLVVVYSVQDATGDASRVVEGRVRLTVKGRPDAPTRPVVQEIRSQTVVLAWDPPIDNGARITEYVVSSPSGYTTSCATATCSLEGLTNDTEYTFTVVARNEVGDSDPSPASEAARPDAVPDPPAAPTVAFGDGQLQITWQNAAYTDRSAIERVDLQISPAPSGGSSVVEGLTGTSYTWTGLTNGQQYQVSLRARNRSTTPSEWGAPSAPEVPAGVPGEPGAPTVTRGSLGERATLTVSWSGAPENGDAIAEYAVTALPTGETKTVSAGQATFDVAARTDAYTFTVTATNKAGTGPRSPASNAVRVFAPAVAPTGVTISAQESGAGLDGRLRLSFSPVQVAGASAGEVGYQYRLGAGGGWTDVASGGTTIGGLTNGTAYDVYVRTVVTVSDSLGSGTSESAEVTATPSGDQGNVPYGPPGTPGLSGSNGPQARTPDHQATVTWSAPAANGRPVTVQLNQNGAGWGDVAASGSMKVGAGYSESVRVCARAVDSTGVAGSETCTTVTTGAKPIPVVTISKGSGELGLKGCSDICWKLNVTADANVTAGSYGLNCFNEETVTVSLSPGGTTQAGCWWGYSGNPSPLNFTSGPDGWADIRIVYSW